MFPAIFPVVARGGYQVGTRWYMFRRTAWTGRAGTAARSRIGIRGVWEERQEAGRFYLLSSILDRHRAGLDAGLAGLAKAS